ncbi:MAG: hypothetical protein QW688_00200 [Thermoprotei archaeon]
MWEGFHGWDTRRRNGGAKHTPTVRLMLGTEVKKIFSASIRAVSMSLILPSAWDAIIWRDPIVNGM